MSAADAGRLRAHNALVWRQGPPQLEEGCSQGLVGCSGLKLLFQNSATQPKPVNNPQQTRTSCRPLLVASLCLRAPLGIPCRL